MGKHEVRPSHRHRYSVNVWYYDTGERDKAIAQAKAKGTIGEHARPVTDADNAASRQFLQTLLGGKANASLATTAELENLAHAAEALPEGAAHMVAQVTMGSSAGPNVTPADIARYLREMAPRAL